MTLVVDTNIRINFDIAIGYYKCLPLFSGAFNRAYFDI